MSRASSAFTGKPFGVTRVCRIWDVARSTVYWRRQPSRPEARRRGPHGFHTDDELVGEIKGVITESPFTGEGYRKVWAMLRDKDIRTSRERTLRLMRENGLLAYKASRSAAWSQGAQRHDQDRARGRAALPEKDRVEGVIRCAESCAIQCQIARRLTI